MSPLIVILVIVLFVIIYRSNKKQKKESLRKTLLEEYSKYKGLVNDFNKSYQSLKVSPVDQVNRMLQIVNPKYELMLPLLKHKDSINNWGSIIKDLKLLKSAEITNNVKIILKRFDLIEKYGADIGNTLANHKYFLGMTEQMLIDVKGKPLNVVMEGVLDAKKVLTYKNKLSEEVFTFVDGKLV